MVKHKKIFGGLWFAALLSSLGIGLLNTAFGATGGTITMQVPQTTYNVGETVSVKLYENSGSTGVSGADLFVTFDTAKLAYAGVSKNGAFNDSQPTPAVNGSVIEIARVSVTAGGLTGSQLVETVNFTATAIGTVNLTYGGGTSQVNATSDGSNIVSSSSGTNFTIQTAPAPTPPPPTGGGGTTPSPTPATPTTSSKGSSVSVSTKSSASPVTVTNGGTAQVGTSVDVQPSTIQTEGVTKVEYFIDGKLVDTETKAPYSYHLDTTQLTNGSHTMVTKTIYANGGNKSSTQHLLVTDGIKKSSATFVWIIPPLIIILVGLAALLYTRFIHFSLRKLTQGPMPAGAGAHGGGVFDGHPAHDDTPPTDNTQNNLSLENLLSKTHPNQTPTPSTVVKPSEPTEHHDNQA